MSVEQTSKEYSAPVAATADMNNEIETSSDDRRSNTDSNGENEKMSPALKDESAAASADEAPQPKKHPNEVQGQDHLKRSKTKIALIMASLMMAVFLTAIDVTIITTALPTISDHFGSAAGYTWVGSAFLLGSAAAIPLWGKFADIFGRKPVLLAANIVFFVGSLIAGLSINIGMLIVARAIQGIGAGGLQSLVQILIADLFSQRQRGLYYGLIGCVWTVASSLGPVVGGAFTQKVTWRWCFYINLPLDGFAFIIILFFLDVKTPKTPLVEGLKNIDWLGALMIIGGTVMFLLGLQYGGESFPWTSAIVLCLIIFGVVCFGLFVLSQKYVARYPVVPLRLLRERSNCAALAVTFVHGFTFIASTYYLPFFYQTVYDATPLLSGVYVIALAVPLSLVSVLTGLFIRKTGKFLPPLFFGLTFMVIGQALYTDFSANRNFAKIIIYPALAGIGFGPLYQAPLIALQAHMRPQDIATGTATFGFIRQLATAMGVVIGQVVFQNEMNRKSATLVAGLGPQLAAELGGARAGANTDVIDRLPAAQKVVIHTAITDSLQKMWILFIVLAFIGLLIAFLIKAKALNKTHTETKTGLEAERENRAAFLAEEEERKRSRGLKSRVEKAKNNILVGGDGAAANSQGAQDNADVEKTAGATSGPASN